VECLRTINGLGNTVRRSRCRFHARRIVFQSNRDGNFEIWVMNADGSNPIALTHTELPVRNLDPAWSPDGKKIIFDSDRDSPLEAIRQVVVMNSDGTDQHSLTTLPGESGHAGWGWTSDDGISDQRARMSPVAALERAIGTAAFGRPN
jgi:Tol biopolymer transport system component